MPNGPRSASRAPTASRCRSGNAILFFPSGARGPAFLVGTNFEVIKRYNISDVFALAVSTSGRPRAGRAPVRARWPEVDRQLTRAERIALQKRLQELGYTVNDFEGRIDFDLRDAIRLEQAKHGMVPDGHPTGRCWRRSGRVILTARPRPGSSAYG